MADKFTCKDTQRVLDGLSDGTPEPEELGALKEHIRDCPDCAMLVRIHEHCATVTQDDLEASVPDAVAGGMWRSVRDRIAERGGAGSPRNAPIVSWLDRWRRGLVPGLAAAVFILAFACGYLFGELRQLRRDRERLAAELAMRVETPRRYSARGIRAGEAHAPGVPAGPAWKHAIPERDSYRIGELIAMLERLPPRMSVLPAVGDRTFPGGTMYRRAIGRCARREGINMKDGLQPGEAVVIARCLDVDTDARVSRDVLFTLIETVMSKGDRS